MATQQVPIMSPNKGVVRSINREGQPPESCWDAQNVLPYDRYGRKRLAQRGGLLRQFSTSTGAFIQGMIEAPNIIYPPGVLTTPAGGLAAIPSYPGTFTAAVGPLPGPPISGPWNGGWKWTFTTGITFGVSMAGGTFMSICFTFPTWKDISGGLPGVLKGFQVSLKVEATNNGTAAGPWVDIEEITIATPTFPTSTTEFFPALAPTFNQVVGASAQALWTFSLGINQAGDWVLTDITDTVTATGSFANIPTMIPAPSLYRATITGTIGDGVFFFKDH